MNKKYVTEKPFELLEQAQADVSVIEDWLKKESLSDNIKHGRSCYHATQAVEKMLKAYLRETGDRKVEKIHNLNVILRQITNKNKNFEDLTRDCAYLNEYTAEMRYGSKNEITKEEVKEVIKRVNNVYIFKEIFNLYAKYSNNNYFILIINKYLSKLLNTELIYTD